MPMKEEIQTDEWKLVYEDGSPVIKGDEVKDFRGESAIVNSGIPPHKENSSGRVYVDSGTDFPSGFFPSVFNLKWKKK